MQVELSTTRPTDYWNIVNHNKFSFSTVWNEIGLHMDKRDTYKLIWYNKNARKFCYIIYMAYMHHLPTSDRLIAWGTNVDPNCNFYNTHSETHQHLVIYCE